MNSYSYLLPIYDIGSFLLYNDYAGTPFEINIFFN